MTRQEQQIKSLLNTFFQTYIEYHLNNKASNTSEQIMSDYKVSKWQKLYNQLFINLNQNIITMDAFESCKEHLKYFEHRCSLYKLHGIQDTTAFSYNIKTSPELSFYQFYVVCCSNPFAINNLNITQILKLIMYLNTEQKTSQFITSFFTLIIYYHSKKPNDFFNKDSYLLKFILPNESSIYLEPFLNRSNCYDLTKPESDQNGIIASKMLKQALQDLKVLYNTLIETEYVRLVHLFESETDERSA